MPTSFALVRGLLHQVRARVLGPRLQRGGDRRREGQPSNSEWGSGIQQLGTADYCGVTDVEWDPSGRYLSMAARAWRRTLKNGYAIWDFRGQELEKHILDRSEQFIWRPRPLLTKDQQRLFRKNLRDYSALEEDDIQGPERRFTLVHSPVLSSGPFADVLCCLPAWFSTRDT
ncbi:hypothetical protein PLICRDRAFT_697108 [Plicaturopsis crispa FD-325 SS-3]|nr:hypothetical protein PLICRDRAFT_697108 [Plicaturopsis crispa FD-325 SS-3]